MTSQTRKALDSCACSSGSSDGILECISNSLSSYLGLNIISFNPWTDF